MTTHLGRKAFIRHLHFLSAQLLIPPLCLTSFSIMSGPPVTFQLVCSTVSFLEIVLLPVSSIRPHASLSSWKVLSSSPTALFLPALPSDLFGHPHPLNVSHQVDFTLYILSLDSFNHSKSRGCSYYYVHYFEVPTPDLLPEFYIYMSICLLGISLVCPKGTVISTCPNKTHPLPSKMLLFLCSLLWWKLPPIHLLTYARHPAIVFLQITRILFH